LKILIVLRKKEEGRRKKEEGRRKKEEGRRKKEKEFISPLGRNLFVRTYALLGQKPGFCVNISRKQR
jgi:hypothetical protein